ncbi:MAG: thiol peroxidase [Phycisphaerae bacterium]|nr:thiol peroxidase [Phycisphaerae bacterium]
MLKIDRLALSSTVLVTILILTNPDLLKSQTKEQDMSQKRTGVQSFKGGPMTLRGPALETGTAAPDFKLTRNDLSDVNLKTYQGKIKILNIVPSLDTPVCDAQTRRFNQEATGLGDQVVVLGISKDLPFAQKRWCAATGVTRVETLSDFRGNFGEQYGVLIGDGPLNHLLARAVFVVDQNDRLVYQQITPELAKEPDYAPVLEAVRKLTGGK